MIMVIQCARCVAISLIDMLINLRARLRRDPRAVSGTTCCLTVITLFVSGCALLPPSNNAVAALVKDANAVAPLAQQQTAREFLSAAQGLEPQPTRSVFSHATTRRTVTPIEYNAMAANEREGFERKDYDDTFYYATHYGSPVAYLRAVEIAGAHGIATLEAARILDIGYGAIGGVRLLAGAGAHVSAIDVDSLLPALYREASDQGSVKAIQGRSGSIKLFNGVYAGNTTLTKLIGNHFNVIVSKNTMKRGFMKPAASRKAYVSFEASDEVLLDTLYDTLAPGGLLVIYNITGPYDASKPATDGRSPFSREQFIRANLMVLAFDASDDAGVRAMGNALGWPAQMGDLDKNLFALYTVVQRPK
jgi:hypothetical protein